MDKKIILGIAIVLIIGAIIYLQGLNPQREQAMRKEIAVTGNGTTSLARIAMKDAEYPKAVELVSPDAYINSEPFNLSDAIGKKVILVDFWTYSCINCQRTLPYLTSWDEKYRDEGLLIVGVHTPEFDFEKELGNVQRAVEKYGIAYPVVLDNEYRTWNAYQNHYWPRHYLIDIDGYIVDDHIGEGAYAETERRIQDLLEERRQALGLNMTVGRGITELMAPDVQAATAEIYLGYGFSRGQFGNAEGWQPGKTVTYALPAQRDAGRFYLDGTWTNNEDNMESANGSVRLTYAAQSVNIVAGAATPTTIHAIVDGQESDVTVSGDDLYPIAAGAFGTHELELQVPAGVRLYTFTFG